MVFHNNLPCTCSILDFSYYTENETEKAHFQNLGWQLRCGKDCKHLRSRTQKDKLKILQKQMQSITIKIQIQGEKLAWQQNHRKDGSYGRLQWECKTVQKKKYGKFDNMKIWDTRNKHFALFSRSGTQCSWEETCRLNITFREKLQAEWKMAKF